MKTYSYCYHVLGCFPGKLDLVIIPKPDTPKFIKSDEMISPNQLYERFRGTDAKGLVSVQVLAALNIHLGSDIEKFYKIYQCRPLIEKMITSYLILKT